MKGVNAMDSVAVSLRAIWGLVRGRPHGYASDVIPLACYFLPKRARR